MKLHRLNHKQKGIRFALFLLGMWGCLISHAAEIYRWVDENGRTHFSDTPPQQTKRSVTRIDSRQFELSPEQRENAEARAAAEKARSAGMANPRVQEKAPSLPSSPTGNAASKSTATDCASLLQRFKVHSECLAPFMNVGGSFKPGAFETCGPAVPYPAKECS